jgi:hypothetical protein
MNAYNESMASLTSPPESVEATRRELMLLYELYRTAALNVKYYGHQAKVYSTRSFWFQVSATIGSLAAVGSFLSDAHLWGASTAAPKFLAAGLAVVAAVAAAVTPIAGWTEKIYKLQNLHFAYGEIFHQAALVIQDIQRSGIISERQIGAATTLHDMKAHLGPLDEWAPNRKLIERFQAEVEEQIPPQSLWMP